jgi:hypothetical protein
MPGFREMLVASAAFATLGHQDTLARLFQIRQKLRVVAVEHKRTYGNLQDHVVAGDTGAIRTFPMTAAVGLELAIVAVAKQCVVVRIRFQINAAAMATVTAGGPAARDVLLPAEGYAAVSAVSCFYRDLCFVDEHGITRVLNHAAIPRFADSGRNDRFGSRTDLRVFRIKQKTAPADDQGRGRPVRLIRRFFRRDGLHVDEAAASATVFELHVTGDQREQRIVLTLRHIFAGAVFGAALPDNDRSRVDQLAAEPLDPEPLSV